LFQENFSADVFGKLLNLEAILDCGSFRTKKWSCRARECGWIL